MNRHARRAAKARNRVMIAYGGFAERDLPTAPCYLCDAPHKPCNFVARVVDDDPVEIFQLCASCFSPGEKMDLAVARKHMGAPGLTISSSSPATAEQFEAVIQKQSATQH